MGFPERPLLWLVDIADAEGAVHTEDAVDAKDMVVHSIFHSIIMLLE